MGGITIFPSLNLLKKTKIETIKDFIKENKKILIKVPANMKLWSIVISAYSFPESSQMKSRSFPQTNAVSVENGFYHGHLQEAKVHDNVDYVFLEHEHLNKLIEYGQCDVKSVGRYILNGKTSNLPNEDHINNLLGYKHRIQPKKEFLRNNVDIIRYYENVRSHGDLPFQFVCDFIFTSQSFFCKGNVTKEQILANRTSIEITPDNIYVFEDDVKPFMVSILDQIPESSPYYLPSKCRGVSDLDELAKIGYMACADGIGIKSENLARQIKSKLGYSEKKANTAAFFIHPNPKRGMKASHNPRGNHLTRPLCQFEVLVYTLNAYWLNEEYKDCNYIPDLIKNSLKSLGYSEESIKFGAEFIQQKKT